MYAKFRAEQFVPARVAGRAARLAGILAALALAVPAAACDLPLLGRGIISAVDSSGELQLEDGRRVRLAALDLDGSGHAGALAAVLSAAALGHPVVLNGPAAADRYGRLVAFVRSTAGTDSLQQLLVEHGLARVRPEEGFAGCLPPLLESEAHARRAGLGIWMAPMPEAADVEAVRQHSGRFAVFEGEILSTGEGRSVYYLNFGPVWRHDVTVRVPRQARAAFIAAGKDPAGLAGRRVRVRGVVFEQDGPVVEARWPEQIEVEGDAGQ